MIVALGWYGPERSDLEIVGPFDSFVDAHAWGEKRGFTIAQVVWTPREREAYDAIMMPDD